MIWKNEIGYLNLMKHVLDNGTPTPDRTGIGRIRVFGQVLEFDLRQSDPIFVHRPMPYRHAFEEFWFFLNGGTDTKELEAKGVKFWQGNTSRKFLDKRGLRHLPEGSYGKAYGFQLRNFNGKLVDGTSFDGVDQIRNVIGGLQSDPYSARHVVTMWNPSQLDEMALPPCWFEHQFVVTTEGGEETLHLRVTARSADLLFGTPANCFQYAVYLIAVAKVCGYIPGKLNVMIGDAHIYENQVDYVKECIIRTFTDARQINESKTILLHKWLQFGFDDFLGLKWEDIELHGYNPNKTPFNTPKPPMAV